MKTFVFHSEEGYNDHWVLAIAAPTREEAEKLAAAEFDHPRTWEVTEVDQTKPNVSYQQWFGE